MSFLWAMTGRMLAPGRTLFPCSESYSWLLWPVVPVVFQKTEYYKNKKLFLLLFLHWVMDCLEMIWSLHGKRSITIWIKQINWQIWTLENGKKAKDAYADIENKITRGKHRVLSVHVCPAYKSHTCLANQVSLIPIFRPCDESEAPGSYGLR